VGELKRRAQPRGQHEATKQDGSGEELDSVFSVPACQAGVTASKWLSVSLFP